VPRAKFEVAQRREPTASESNPPVEVNPSASILQRQEFMGGRAVGCYHVTSPKGSDGATIHAENGSSIALYDEASHKASLMPKPVAD